MRLAATVSTDAEAEEFRQFLDEEKIAEEDRVIRRIALRGAASEGLAVTRTDLMPEVTITAEGVYWHPVGAEDEDLLVTREFFLSPNPSLPSAAPSTANANTRTSWQNLQCAERRS